MVLGSKFARKELLDSGLLRGYGGLAVLGRMSYVVWLSALRIGWSAESCCVRGGYSVDS